MVLNGSSTQVPTHKSNCPEPNVLGPAIAQVGGGMYHKTTTLDKGRTGNCYNTMTMDKKDDKTYDTRRYTKLYNANKI